MRTNRWLIVCLAAALLALPGTAAAAPPSNNDVEVQLLGFNDFHGALKPPSGSAGTVFDPSLPGGSVLAGGAAFFATWMQTFKAQNPNTLVVSAGDLIGASPLTSALFHDEPTIEAMNEIGLDLNAVGNHEFDEGVVELMRMKNGGCHPVDGCRDGNGFEGADFGFLAANVIDNVTRQPIFPPYAIRRFGNTKIGFIGMTLEGTPDIVLPSAVESVTFLDEADTANKYARILREEHGVRAIVVLLHEGAAQSGTGVGINTCNGIGGAVVNIVERTTKAVDLFVTGHTHNAYNCVIDDRPVTSAASNGRLITDIDLTLDHQTKDVVEVRANNEIVRRNVAEDSAIQALVSRYDVLARPFADRIVGFISAAFTKTKDASGENQAGNFIADSQHFVTDDEEGALAAFMNPGGVRDPGLTFTPPGPEPLTYEDIFTLQPFGNNVTTITLTGADLLTMLKQQWCGRGGTNTTNVILLPSASVSYTWDQSDALASLATAPAACAAAPSPVVGDVTLSGQVVTPGGSYRITVNSFLADGGDGFSVLRNGTDRVGGAIDLDAVEAFLAASPSPLAPPPLDRINVVP